MPEKKAGKRAVLKKTDKTTSRERPKARTADVRLPKIRQKSTNPIKHKKKLSKRPRQGNAQDKIRRKFRVSPLAHKKADSTPPAAFSETAHFLRGNSAATNSAAVKKSRATGWQGGKKSGQPAGRGVVVKNARQKKSGQKGRISADIRFPQGIWPERARVS